MKSASNTLPDQAPQDLTAGLDWARDDHAVSIVNDRGREIARHTIEHTAAGLIELVAVLTRAGCQEVAIERPDGPVVDALLGAGVTVVVISPNQVKNLRGRYGSAGNKDDRFDAYVLADTLRTDGPGCGHWCPTHRKPSRCAESSALAAIWSPTAWPGQPTARPPSPGLPRCGRPVPADRLLITLAFLTRFPTQTKPTGSPRPDSAGGCPRSATDAPTRPRCTPI